MVMITIAGMAGIAALSMVTLVLVPAAICAGVRRLHDNGKSGWFLLIPFYNLYLAIIDGEAAPNAYGAVPSNQGE